MQTFNLTYRCPDIRTQEEAEMVRETLATSPGVGEIEVDYRTGEVRVSTSNQDGGKDLLARLIGSGYPPED